MTVTAMSPEDVDRLRFAVRTFYDFQEFRIAAKNRGKKKKGEDEGEVVIDLSDADREFIGAMGDGLEKLEKKALKEIKRIGVAHPMWGWITEHRGIGPTLAGFILAEFRVEVAPNPSSFWKFAGLHVVRGHNPRPVKGKKLEFNARARAKMIAVLGGCLIKANNEEYRAIYDNAKHRKENQIGVCMACEGKGYVTKAAKKGETPAQKLAREAANAKAKAAYDEGKKKSKCWNCDGTKRAPWGRGKAHRHAHANRVMVKEFLVELWMEWRKVAGLPTRTRYSEEKLGLRHTGT